MQAIKWRTYKTTPLCQQFPEYKYNLTVTLVRQVLQNQLRMFLPAVVCGHTAQ